MEKVFQGAVQPVAAGEQAFAGLGKPLAGVVAQDGGGEAGYMKLMAVELIAEGGLQTKRVIVEALGEAVQQRGDARLGAA